MSHVNVAMRVRPTDDEHGDYITIVPPGTMLINKGDNDMYQFAYTHAASKVSNEAIYDEVGKPVVESVLDGYNGTILAYGQTGSGKTWTMLGPAGPLSDMPADLKGIMPRCLDALFKSLRTNTNLTNWKMSISYVEVYCEVIRDLLSVDKTARETAGKGKAAQAGLDVIESKEGVMHLKNLGPTQVASMADVSKLIERAQSVRAQAATNMNDRSSRSHTILTVWLETDTADGKFHSKLNLVDLAGSERRKAVGDKGAATSKEGDAINKSLLTLQNVVMALGQKGAVPSFRTSKLTHFLKDSIGGNCKTTLCACAWGDPSKVSETLATCRFAEKMMKVVVNAKKNKGGLSTVHGNKVKLDPTVLAIMEKRVQDGIAAARAELMAQYGGGTMGGGMSDEEKEELAALRARVAGLGQEQQGVVRVPSQVELEMEMLKKQLASAEQKAQALQEASEQAEHAAAQQASEPEQQPAQAAGGMLDDSVQAFIKLKELQPQQHALQSKLEQQGLEEEDKECLEFINDEIQRLLDILQQHGFNFPEGAGVQASDEGELLAQKTVDAALYADTDLDDLISEPEEEEAPPPPPVAAPMRKPPMPRNPSRNRAGPPPGAGNLQTDPSLYPSAGAAMQGTFGNMRQFGSGTSRTDMMAVPDDLVKPAKTGVLSMFRKDKKGSAMLSDDNLNAHNHLQSANKAQQPANDMVFMSPMDYDSVKAVLEDHSQVDATLPLDLTKMPPMPPAPK